MQRGPEVLASWGFSRRRQCHYFLSCQISASYHSSPRFLRIIIFHLSRVVSEFKSYLLLNPLFLLSVWVHFSQCISCLEVRWQRHTNQQRKHSTKNILRGCVFFFFFFWMPVSSAKLALLLVPLSEFGAWFSIVAVINWHAVS